MIQVDSNQSRAFTNAIVNAVDSGELDAPETLKLVLRWMSEAEVKEFALTQLGDVFRDAHETDEDD